VPGHSPPAVLLVTGPTGVGKSEAAVLVAERLGGEIVSADSRQVYRGLAIGTAAPAPALLARIPHHLVGVLEVEETWSAGAFAARAGELIEAIRGRGRQPMVVGGSGLYLKALTEGLFVEPASDPRRRRRVRVELQRRLREEGIVPLRAELAARDPDWAGSVSATDTQRILRGLEVLALHGVPLSSLQAGGAVPVPVSARWCRLVLERERGDLYRRIEDRVDALLEAGWLEEARVLLEAGVPADAPGLTGLGYTRLFGVLAGDITLDEARRAIRQEHRNFAKRQLTWFRPLRDVVRLKLQPGDGPVETAAAVLRAWESFPGE
jgi:tRNA dimethylallyltransferase